MWLVTCTFALAFSAGPVVGSSSARSFEVNFSFSSSIKELFKQFFKKAFCVNFVRCASSVRSIAVASSVSCFAGSVSMVVFARDFKWVFPQIFPCLVSPISFPFFQSTWLYQCSFPKCFFRALCCRFVFLAVFHKSFFGAPNGSSFSPVTFSNHFSPVLFEAELSPCPHCLDPLLCTFLQSLFPSALSKKIFPLRFLAGVFLVYFFAGSSSALCQQFQSRAVFCWGFFHQHHFCCFFSWWLGAKYFSMSVVSAGFLLRAVFCQERLPDFFAEKNDFMFLSTVININEN